MIGRHDDYGKNPIFKCGENWLGVEETKFSKKGRWQPNGIIMHPNTPNCQSFGHKSRLYTQSSPQVNSFS